MNIVLYGPPGVGKTTVGKLIAERLGREFVDGDEWIASRWDRPVPDYFSGDEALFRAREAEACRKWSARDELVIAPGGGALLNPHSRAALEATGAIFCLTAALDTLLTRLNGGHVRPLLSGDPAARLSALLREREPLYHSFVLQVSTDARSAESVAASVIATFRDVEGVTRFELGGCSALMGQDVLARLPELLTAKNLRPPFVVISDSEVASLHGDPVSRLLSAPLIQFAAGEAHKTLDTVRELYSGCLAHGLERGGTVLALGGGVVGDVAGFVAATFMRGVRWVNLPTTVLAMADASIGGKVGVDLPEGKNLVGAFHPPTLVVSDLDTLTTLPDPEFFSGFAEVVKAGVIGDPDLLAQIDNRRSISLSKILARAAAVKVGIVNADPYEQGERAKLNLGHTIGHGVEAASGYALRHGESISIGMVAEAHLAEAMGLAESGISRQIAFYLQNSGLPTRSVNLKPETIRALMKVDKKMAGGKLKFTLPKRIGEVVWGIEADEKLLRTVLETITHAE